MSTAALKQTAIALADRLSLSPDEVDEVYAILQARLGSASERRRLENDERDSKSRAYWQRFHAGLRAKPASQAIVAEMKRAQSFRGEVFGRWAAARELLSRWRGKVPSAVQMRRVLSGERTPGAGIIFSGGNDPDDSA